MPQDALSIIISFLSGGIGGSLTGATVAHFLTKRRDKVSRRANFLGFLNAWETQVDYDRKITHGFHLPPGAVVVKSIGKVARDFIEKRVELIDKARGLEPNYWGKTLSRFQALTKTVVDMPVGQIDSDPKQLLRALRDLSEFVEKQ